MHQERLFAGNGLSDFIASFVTHVVVTADLICYRMDTTIGFWLKAT